MTSLEELKERIDSCIKVDIDIKNIDPIISYWAKDSWQLEEDDSDSNLKLVKLKFTSDDNKPVADLELRLIFSYYLYHLPTKMVDYVDDFDADSSDGFSALAYSDEFNLAFENIEEELSFERSYSGVLQTFYVYPEYRNSGLGNFIMNNLSKILWKYCGWEILCLTTYLNPYLSGQKGKYAKNVGYKSDDDLYYPDKAMLETMRKAFNKWGFTKLDIAEEHYIKVFGWRYELINTPEGLYFVGNDR